MRENATEIKKVLDEHQYSINAIIFEVMGTFKLNSIIRKAGFAKQDGYGVAEILTLMIMLPPVKRDGHHNIWYLFDYALHYISITGLYLYRPRPSFFIHGGAPNSGHGRLFCC